MKRLLLFLLCLSLGTNAWMFWGRVPTDATSRASAAMSRLAASAALDSNKSAVPLPLAGIESPDAAVIADSLRAAGADDSTVRAMLEGILRRRHREKLASIRIERESSAWWRNGRTAQEPDATLSMELITGPLSRVLGRDPLEIAAAESRYSFLSPETRRILALIDLDYKDLLRTGGVSATTAQLAVEAKEQKLLVDEKSRDVLAALSPEERAEYDLRFAGSARMLNERAVLMDTTEAEYRALKRVIDDFDAKSKALPRGETFVAAYEDIQRAAATQLVDTVGYDRAVDYLWSGYHNYYAPLRSAASSGQISADVPGRVMELTADTGRRAAGVHAETALTLDQKKAALVALQQTTQAQLDALLPRDVQRGLPPEAMRWLNDLSAGRYSLLQPSLLSSGGYNSFAITSSVPPRRVDAPAMPVKP